MDMKEVLSKVVAAVEDKKAHDPVVLNIQGLSVVADYFIICHGNSELQVQAIAKEVQQTGHKLGLFSKAMEGFDDARWVLVDLGDIVVHIFHREEREYYNLEKLWADAQRLEVGGV